MAGAPPAARRSGRPEVNIDVPGVVSQFLSELSSFDLVVELVQNELDAGSTRTEIVFGQNALFCQGEGNPIDAKGWRRLRYVLGAGGEVEAKADGIGSKNHGLRSAFLIGDEIVVQSGGRRIDLTVRGKPDGPDAFYPAVWPPVADGDAPETGTRISVPYRSRPLTVPERNPLEPLTPAIVDGLFADAVSRAADRFLCASAPGRRWRYELVLRREGGARHVFVFECVPADRRPGLFERTCRHGASGRRPRVAARCAGAPFDIVLASDDMAKVPRLYRRGGRLLGELCWPVDANGAPMPGSGALRYPIAYPLDQVRTGHGFDVSGPFISGRARHSVSDDARNDLIVEAARSAFVELLASRLVPTHGPAALALVGDASRADLAAEDGLVDGLLSRGGLPTAMPSGTASRRLDWAASDVDRPLALAAPSYDPERLSATLSGLAPPAMQAVHPRTPAAFVRALLRAVARGRANIRRFDERDAAMAVCASGTPGAGKSPPSGWVDRCHLALKELQTARQRDALKPDFMRALRERGVLPATSGMTAPWAALHRSPRPVPAVPGVMPPAILHVSLAKLKLLQDGVGKVPLFKLDAHVSNRKFDNVTAEGRRRFFDWLRKGCRQLSPQTLGSIALYPIWPGSDGAYRPLDAYCRPRSARLRAMLREVRAEPAEDLVTFPGLTRGSRGALRLRVAPVPAELRDWHLGRMARARAAEAEGRQGDLHALVGDTEEQLDGLREDATWSVREIAAGHLTLSASGKLAPATALHAATPRVARCRLLPDDMTRGDRDALHAALGSPVAPSTPALLRALRGDHSYDALFARLEAYESAGEDLGDLSDEPVVPVRGTAMRPGHLCFPGKANWWGDWKTPLDRTPEEPTRSDLLARSGVVRPSLREDLSRAFFEWLSSQGAIVQRRHRRQIIRHWAERRYGPSRWILRHPDLPCIAVRGRGGVFELVSRAQVGMSRSQVFLPDFTEVQERMIDDSATLRLAVVDAQGVEGSILTSLKEAGVPSLRERVGRPARLYFDRELIPDGPLEGELALLRSARIMRTLTQRLPNQDVPPSALRHNWRRLLGDLQGVRRASRITAVHRLFGREYELETAGAVDEPTGLVCIGPAADPKLALYDALARHVFNNGTSALSAYGLLRAVHAEHAVAILDDDVTDVGDPPAEEDQVSSEGNDAPDPPQSGHASPGDRAAPSAPAPGPLPQISNPTFRPGGRARAKPARATSGTAALRNSVEEEEQKRQLKERHYAWHCQACLGRYEVLEAAPPDSYLYLPAQRRGLIEAHHVRHLQNAGGLGASNLLVLCRYHHQSLGDRLSASSVRDALKAASPVTRNFPTDLSGGETVARDGLSGTIVEGATDGDVRLYFTLEHAASWLAGN